MCQQAYEVLLFVVLVALNQRGNIVEAEQIELILGLYFRPSSMPMSLKFQTVPTVEEVYEKFDDFGLVGVVVPLKTLPFIIIELQVAYNSLHDELKNDVSFTNIFQLHIEHATCEVLAICHVM